jgi:hypothetical protein
MTGCERIEGERGENARVGAVHNVPYDPLVGCTVSGFALLYPTYEIDAAL